MAKRRTISIEVVVDEKGALRGIRGVDGKLKGLEKTLDRTSRSGFNLGSVFSIALGNVMANAVQLFGRAIRTLVDQGAKLIGQSADIFETQSKLEAVFQSSTGRVEEFIESYANLAGMSKTVAKEMVSTTGAILEGAGFGASAAADMSIAVTRLAGDLTSFTNIPVEETLRAIQGALTGEREMLKRLGIVLLETDVQKRALNMTGKESARALTQQDKATASLKLITEKAGVAVGDLERTQDSAANQMRQIQARFQDLRDELAIELLPAITNVATGLNDFLKDPALQAGAKALGEALAKSLGSAIEVTRETIGFLKNFKGEIKSAVDVVLLLGIAMATYKVATVAAWVALNIYTSSTTLAVVAQKALNLAMRLSPVGLFMTALVTGFIIVDRWSQKIRDATTDTIDFEKALRDAAGAFRDLSKAEAEAELVEIISRQSEIGVAVAKLRAANTELKESARSETGLLGGLKQTVEIGKNSTQILEMVREAQENAAKIVTLRKQIAGDLGAGAGGGGGGGAEDPAEEFDRGRFDEQMEASRLRVEAEQEMFAALREARQEDFAFQLELDAEMEAHKADQLAKEKALADKQKKLEEQKVAANQAAIAAMIAADDQSIQSAEDAAVAIARSVRRIIKAKLAEAIAVAIAKEARKGIFGLITGAIVAAGITLLFNKFLPAFEHGGRGISSGFALVGEKGPEIIHTPQGSSVIPAPQTARMMAGAGEPVEVFGVINGEDIFLSSKRAGNRLDRMGHA